MEIKCKIQDFEKKPKMKLREQRGRNLIPFKGIVKSVCVCVLGGGGAILN